MTNFVNFLFSIYQHPKKSMKDLLLLELFRLHQATDKEAFPYLTQNTTLKTY